MVKPGTRVLIISNERDVSVDWVVRELRSLGVPFLRLNTERLHETSLCVDPMRDSWRLARRHEAYDLSNLASIWYRRPEPPAIAAEHRFSEPELRLLTSQWRAVVDGLCSLPGVRIINDPWAVSRAESKLLQLRTAGSLGFRVPETLVTNSGSAARHFARGRDVIVKGLDAPLIEDDEQPRFVYAQRASTSILHSLSERELAPLIFQEEVHDKLDIRVTVVGNCVFAAEARVSGNTVDWP